MILEYLTIRGNHGLAAPGVLPNLLTSFSFFLVIGAAYVPLGIASYSIVGEKVEKSLEPLLATPLTDGEILLGKAISAVIPTLVAMYAAAAVFMVGIDEVTFQYAWPLLFSKLEHRHFALGSDAGRHCYECSVQRHCFIES